MTYPRIIFLFLFFKKNLRKVYRIELIFMWRFNCTQTMLIYSWMRPQSEQEIQLIRKKSENECRI
jgi:hypothetical protein